jgi:hypothetical protein
MDVGDKWNKYEIVVDEDVVDFVEVPSNHKQLFHNGVPQAIFLDVVLVFLRPGPSVCGKTPSSSWTQSGTTSKI